MQESKKKILCVEPYSDTCELITLALEDHEVIGVSTAAAALDRAMEDIFDLCILAYFLPDRTGLELCQALREFDQRTPIIFCTNNLYLTTAQIEKAGAQLLLKKTPDFIDDLQSAVALLLTPTIEK